MNMPSTAWLQATFAPIFELIDSSGEDIIVREFVAVGTPLTDHLPIKAKPNPARVQDLIEGSLAKQGDQFLIARAESFPVARRLDQRDRIFFRGRDWAVMDDDSNQYSIGGTVYARVLHVRG
jgi:hypothetical protein